MKRFVFILPVLLTLTVLGYVYQVNKVERTGQFTTGSQVKSDGFHKLSEIRKKKKQEVVDYFAGIKNKVEQVKTDNQLLDLFSKLQTVKTKSVEYQLDEIYVSNYSEFYDILLIEPNGLIFSSVRKEPDYLGNIFEQNLFLEKGHKLDQQQISYIDYKNYTPSSEGAAFFAVPIHRAEHFEGWLVFQLAMNKINWILTDRKELGRTGEVYLVNKDMILLTESRFINESSALKLKIDTTAVRTAMTLERGERILEDYRGVRVLSSFERFELFGAIWIIIAEIDEAEILTDAFIRDASSLYPEISTQSQTYLKHNSSFTGIGSAGQVVNVSEFQRSSGTNELRTYGVATCTAIGIQLPDKFTYLAHISPIDEIYSTTTGRQNLIAQLLSRITYFELLPVEKQSVQFIIVAPHTQSLSGAINTILTEGFDIANIRLAINRNASGANIQVRPFREFKVEWYGNNQRVIQDALALPTLQYLYSQVIGYSES